MYISDIIENKKLTLECKSVDKRADSLMQDSAFHWDCNLVVDGKPEYNFNFSCGKAHSLLPKSMVDYYEKHGNLVNYKAPHIIPKNTNKGYVKTPFGLLGLQKRTIYENNIIEKLLRPSEPSLENVLECFITDCSSYEYCRDFEDWCSNFGYDPDSRKVFGIYEAINSQTKNLRFIFFDIWNEFLEALPGSDREDDE